MAFLSDLLSMTVTPERLAVVSHRRSTAAPSSRRAKQPWAAQVCRKGNPWRTADEPALLTNSA
jgi:hypothetical protein